MRTRLFAPVTENLLKRAYGADRARLGRMAMIPDEFRLEVKHLQLALESRGVNPAHTVSCDLTADEMDELRKEFVSCYREAAKTMPESRLNTYFVGLALAGYDAFARVFAAEMDRRKTAHSPLADIHSARDDLIESLTPTPAAPESDHPQPVLLSVQPTAP